jgi:effector-binding domain-containing protein
MLDAPHVTQSEAQPAAVLRLAVPRAEMRQAMGDGIAELMATLAAQGVAPAGAMYAHHFRMDPDVFDFAIGIPVATPIVPAGRVTMGELPAARVARAIYRGSYEGLGAAWGEFGAWIAAGGHAPAPGLWERYLRGPESSTDPMQWETELNRPLVA